MPANQIEFKILVAETASHLKQMISRHLSANHCYVASVNDCDELTQKLLLDNYNAIYLGDQFAGTLASNNQVSVKYAKLVALVKRLKAVSSTTRIIIVSTEGQGLLPVELLKAGIDDYLTFAKGESQFLVSLAASLKYLYQRDQVKQFNTPQKFTIQKRTPSPKVNASAGDRLPVVRLLRNLPGSALVVDKALVIIGANPKCERLLGFGRQALKGIPLKQLLPGKIYNEIVEITLVEDVFVHPKFIERSVEIVVLDRFGNGVPVQCIIKPLRLNHITGFSFSFQDLSSSLDVKASQILQLKWQRVLNEYSQKFITSPVKAFPQLIKQLLNQSAKIFMCDHVYMYRFNKDNSSALLSYEWAKSHKHALKRFSREITVNTNSDEIQTLLKGESLKLKPLQIVKRTALNQGLGLSEHLAHCGSKNSYILPLKNEHKVYGWIGFDSQREGFEWQDAEIDNMHELIATVNRAMVRKKYEEMRHLTHLKLIETHGKLSEQACIDELTQLANRRYFDQILQTEISRAARNNSYVSLVLCDIDYFKEYNDNYGHLAGDVCLRQVAKKLLSSFKRAADLVARFGGEEFVIILPGLDCRGAYEAAEKMRNSLFESNISHKGAPLGRLTISVGLTCLQSPPLDCSRTLIERADRALYRAKYRGKNRVFVYQRRTNQLNGETGSEREDSA